MPKTENSGVWFYQNAAGMWERWALPLLTGVVDWVWKGSYPTAWAVPCGSSCSGSYSYGWGRILESGVGYCLPVCGGLSHSL